MDSIAKAIVGGLTSAIVNLMAQPDFASAWHIVWTTALAYLLGHLVVWAMPNASQPPANLG